MVTYHKAHTGLIALMVAAIVSLGFWANPAGAEDCKQTTKSLRGDYEVLQADGGLWRFMEKSSRLKKDSMIGFQIDTKIQRLVVHLEGLCNNGKSLPADLLKDTTAQMDMARSINNKSTERTPAKKLLKMLTALNDNLNQVLQKHGL